MALLYREKEQRLSHYDYLNSKFLISHIQHNPSSACRPCAPMCRA